MKKEKGSARPIDYILSEYTKEQNQKRHKTCYIALKLL